MPNYAHHTFEGGGIAIWYITETSDELYALLATQRHDAQLLTMKNESRRAEWLAVRVLLRRMCGDNARIVYDEAGKPMLCNAVGFISVSHTKGYAVLAHSESKPVGIDVEQAARNASLASRRFLNEVYLAQVPEGDRDAYVLACWCSCEALFKLLGNIGGTYKENIFVKPFAPSSHGVIDLSVKGVPYVDDSDHKAVYINDGELFILLVTGE